MNKVVYLMVLFKNARAGNFQVLMPITQAKKIIANWLGKELAEVYGFTDIPMSPDTAWAFDVSEVACMYTIDPESLRQAQQQMQQQSAWPPPDSRTGGPLKLLDLLDLSGYVGGKS